MKLPDRQRVIYQHTPLIEVVGQLRFPTILKINDRLNFNHGLVRSQDQSKPNFQEIGYLFDADLFLEEKITKGEMKCSQLISPINILHSHTLPLWYAI